MKVIPHPGVFGGYHQTIKQATEACTISPRTCRLRNQFSHLIAYPCQRENIKWTNIITRTYISAGGGLTIWEHVSTVWRSVSTAHSIFNEWDWTCRISHEHTHATRRVRCAWRQNLSSVDSRNCDVTGLYVFTRWFKRVSQSLGRIVWFGKLATLAWSYSCLWTAD